MARRTDVEIFLLDCPVDRLLTWIEKVIGKPRRALADDTTTIYHVQTGQAIIPVVVTPNIDDGPWVSVWINSPLTPWFTDLDCARQAAQELHCQVRCNASAPNEPPSQFIQLANGQEELIDWSPSKA